MEQGSGVLLACYVCNCTCSKKNQRCSAMASVSLFSVLRNRSYAIPGLIQSSLTRFSSAEASAVTGDSHSAAAGEEELKPFSAIPGPKPLPVLRNLLELKRNLHRLHLYIEECHKKYGKIFKLETPGSQNNFVVMADPKYLEAILRAEGKYPDRDNNFTPNLEWISTKLNYPPAFGVKSGKEWKDGRASVNNQIKPRNVLSYTPGLNDVVERFTEYLKSTKDENDRISDIARPLKRLLVDMSGKFVYNIDIHAFDNPNEETEEFIDGVTMFFDCIGRMVVEPPLYKLYPNKLYRDFSKSFKATKAFGLKHARRVRQSIENEEEEGEVQGLLEQWLREGKITDEEAIMLSADMFFAGVDTTANQAAILLYFMAKNPEVQEELYEQIRSVIGEQSHPTYEDLSKIPYLKGCVMESFRLLSTATANTRFLNEDTAIMGYQIPAKTNVWYATTVAGKNEQLFPNPEKFDPARWTRDKPNPFAIIPFGFGPRSCYGKRFAELELKILLCQMTQKFMLRTELEDLETVSIGVVKPVGDLPLYLKKRH